ncbi:LacI family DNA-binding transcriptional regulator [Komagataeibacter rhaeticus]|nr:LacI family DNA-binding transcriptional regulator [Komagataeibacter rhaeticus]
MARLAGVSVSTASRVINRTCGVSPAYAAAVQAVLERFSYIPNNAARALVRQKTRTVGLVVPTLSNPCSRHPSRRSRRHCAMQVTGCWSPVRSARRNVSWNRCA